MVRTILKLDTKNLTLDMPDDLVGKMIEIIAFPVEEIKPTVDSPVSKETKINILTDKLKPFVFNSGGYKFDRNDANDYE